MRGSSSYTRPASRSNAVWSPPLQALNKPVISADRGSIAIPKKKISRPWPFSRPLPPVAVEVEQEMKTTRLVAMLAMAGASLCAGQSAATQKATVTVCMEPDQHVLMGVRPLASAMFASIGVRIAWHERDSCPVGVGAVQVRLSPDRSEEHTSELQSLRHLVCRLLLENKQ